MNDTGSVMSMCHMFPNSQRPSQGVFVKERLNSVAKKIRLIMVAPIPYFPMMTLFDKYHGLDRVGDKEISDTLTVYHPRYLLIPKYLKSVDCYLYQRSLDSYISAMIAENGINLLDFHWVYPDGIAGLHWAKKYGKKIIVTVRGNEAIYYHEKGSKIRTLLREKLSEFDHIISVSSDLKNKMVQDYRVPPDKISVIPNGIDANKFHSTDKKAAKRACGFDESKRLVVCISRLSEEKGLKYLIQALSKMEDRSVELAVVGDGPLRDKLKSAATDFGIIEKVHFPGAVQHSETSTWYNAADVFCLPSLWEGCPNVVIEALACGTPVVASSVGGIPDLMPSEDLGYLTPPGDSDALALALTAALDRTWDRELISWHGSGNSWDAVADKVVDVFRKVLR